MYYHLNGNFLLSDDAERLMRDGVYRHPIRHTWYF